MNDTFYTYLTAEMNANDVRRMKNGVFNTMKEEEY
ncbi:hypothetical protein T4B_2112 [Trichinella pseudospiralis]|uniref:Uncharacterized protein n=2 Tax=Trichinella pseudospiralis TaxID=6337 RepID=A0A0V1G753_TRIPS|nr:hypothetical protein T4D_10065 [Trichinella pseudospiralis]KRY94132.1 hypothetical protein T4B_2112 [Trichinella pseudospiralis]